VTPGPLHADRLLVVLSDLELAAREPNGLDPSEWIAELLVRRVERADGLPVEIVLNGDTLDFLKTPGLVAHPHHITESVALRKLERIAASHTRFLRALGNLLRADPDRRLHLTLGNHDLEFAFDAVQERFRELCGLDAHCPQVRFPGHSLKIGDVYIEHGCQRDPMFQVDTDDLFVSMGGRTLLGVPWGTVALLATVVPLKEALGHLDRIKPRDRIFEILPEAREFLLKLMWRYWTRQFPRDWVGGDPLQSGNWTLFREVLYRFGTSDTDVHTAPDQYLDLVRDPDGPRMVLLGHAHVPAWLSYGDRKVLVTGAMRDEFLLEADARTTTLLPKTFAEVWMRGEVSVRSRLVEAFGPPPAPGQVPESLEDLRPTLQVLLGTESERAASRDEQAAQVERESRGKRLMKLLR